MAGLNKKTPAKWIHALSLRDLAQEMSGFWTTAGLSISSEDKIFKCFRCVIFGSLVCRSLSDFCKLHAQIQILVETSLNHFEHHLEENGRVLRVIDCYAAAKRLLQDL